MRNVYSSWLSSAGLYEKYSCEEDGQPGGGGEYSVQTGFGWTNGVSLALLAKYPDLSSASPGPPTTSSLLLGLISVMVGRVM